MADNSLSRVTFFSHSIEACDLSPGDHIYVYRNLYIYQHHGIYTGEEGREVIHFSGDDKRSATVCATTLSEFLDGGTLRIVTYNDPLCWLKRWGTSHSVLCQSAEEVMTCAKRFLQHPEHWGRYELCSRNCETFAYYCKTGLDVDGFHPFQMNNFQVDSIMGLWMSLKQYMPSFVTHEAASSNKCLICSEKTEESRM